MNIVLLVIGKTNENYLLDALLKYQKRLKHYIRLKEFDLNDIKNIKKNQVSGAGKEKRR